jgi:peptide/nickel transport system ATP-binding protein
VACLRYEAGSGYDAAGFEAGMINEEPQHG